MEFPPVQARRMPSGTCGLETCGNCSGRDYCTAMDRKRERCPVPAPFNSAFGVPGAPGWGARPPVSVGAGRLFGGWPPARARAGRLLDGWSPARAGTRSDPASEQFPLARLASHLNHDRPNHNTGDARVLRVEHLCIRRNSIQQLQENSCYTPHCLQSPSQRPARPG